MSLVAILLVAFAADPPTFTGTKAGEEKAIAGMKLCLCPPGSFTMGSTADEPERRYDHIGFRVVAGQTSNSPTVKEPALREEILKRTKEDQDARNEWIEAMKETGANGAIKPEHHERFERLHERVNKADRENTAWMKTIIAKHGWPTHSLVGKDGAGSAWLLVQHADADIKFQRQCLDLMAKLPKEEISFKNVAYLTDRVLLAEGKKQIYGTQFTSVDGKWKPRPLEDEANVDKRRAEVGLPPLAEYARQLETMYGGKK